MRRLVTNARAIGWLVIVGTILLGGCEATAPTDDEEWAVWTVRLPPPALDPPPSAGSGLQTAVLAGGCFWGVELVFEHVKGVEEVIPGYSGGTQANAYYAAVTTGTTGHAEVVRIRFDPEKISFGKILQVFFSVAHDPTQVNEQFPDTGPEYRSHIYFANASQGEVARAYIAQLEGSGLLPAPIATRVDPLVAFYQAEAEHHDYAALNPKDPQVIRFELPKLDSLKSVFPDLYQGPSGG
jgi:peptide-methionine (S)-S-oxide reductase